MYVLAVHHKRVQLTVGHNKDGTSRRKFNEWEIETITKNFKALTEFKGAMNQADRLWWTKIDKACLR